MIIIQVAGLSSTGKTTFIRELIPVLARRGKVAAVKHLGDHSFCLEEGKDTTGFFESGADIAVGIDSRKSVIAIRDNSLDAMLGLLKGQDIDFVILEGFKQRPFRKIVIGDLTIEGSILHNPTPDDVVAALSRFDTC